jgi:hypothetical protein
MYPQLLWLSSKVPNYSIVGANNYDDNYSAHGSEDSILPENYEQTKQNDPIGKISLRYNPRSSHASKKSKLENMSENIHEICGNKKFMNIGAKQRQKTQ